MKKSGTVSNIPSKLYQNEINSLMRKLIKSKNKRAAGDIKTDRSENNCSSMSIQKYRLKLELNMDARNKNDIDNLLYINLNNLNNNHHSNNTHENEDKFINDLIEKLKIRNSNYKNSFQILKNLKLVPDIQILLRNENFLENVLKFIQNIIFRFPKYIIADPNSESVAYIGNTIFEEIIFQEDSTPLKIKNEGWNNLSAVYEILIFLINNYYSSPAMKKYFDKYFLDNLIDNLHNFDIEERFIVKIIIHKLYGGSLLFRKPILKRIEHKLLDMAFNANRITDIVGINEIFEILKCIISGLNKPIKKSFLIFINLAVFPLLKNKYLKNIWSNFQNFLLKISSMDNQIANYLVQYMSITWPHRYPDKIILYMELIENVINLNTVKLFNLKNLLIKIIRSTRDINFLISDKSMSMFKSGRVIKLFSDYCLLNLIARNLVENINSHWNDDIKIISKLVISKLITCDIEFLKKVDPREKKYIDNLNLSEYTEEMWGVHFDLKAD